MEFYERVSGARMHAAFYRPNEVDWTGLNYQFFLDVVLFTRDCFKSLTEIFAAFPNSLAIEVFNSSKRRKFKIIPNKP